MNWLRTCMMSGVASFSLMSVARGATPVPPPVDLSSEPTLYVVGYAHLDTEWRWCYPQTIREFIPNTLHHNFVHFEKYPSYVFNFTGSRRYQMMQEYYPADFERMKQYVAQGRWFPCGSSVDENDANVPSAESIIRHVLYGNHYFRREFGVASEEYMLPDCFGFPAALPSILAHCGIKGFSTQKLTWGLAIGQIPFNVGVWEGPDGHGVIAALNPLAYVGEVKEDLSKSETWQKRIDATGKVSGAFTDYHYYGTGDQGGAPTDQSVKNVELSVHSKGPIKVVSSQADWMFKAITPQMRAKLPRYSGELLLTEHSAGSITSEAYMKRWNRKNELLADSAERAAVAAWWMGGRPYPTKKLEDAWYLVLGSQMHDILPGTSHPTAYDYAWNDEVIAGNQFATVLEDAAGVVASAMDTRGSGASLVVYNPLSVDREDVVEAEIPGDSASKGVTVTGPDGKSTPAQVLAATEKGVRIAFLARVPSVGFASYDARLTATPAATDSPLRVGDKRLENERYTVKIDDNGDVASILDKKNNRELLSGPARLGLHYENPRNWPAWNQDWEDRQKPAREYVGGPARIRVLEHGPARVAIEVVRELGSSTFTQRIRLCAGDAGDRVEFDNTIDWAARERSLRAAFPLSVRNPKATYDIHVGTIERGNGNEHLFEYPVHQWFDLTDTRGDYGVTVMNDCKYGADKPDDRTVRLTLLHTPGVRGGYQDQATQDLGRHHILYAVAGHKGDWREGRSAIDAARLNQPLLAFRSAAHEGSLGKSFSLLQCNNAQVRVSAVKKAEDSDEVVVRLRELSGRPAAGVRISLARPISAAREVDGQERELHPGKLADGALVTDIGASELRTFALKLGAAPATVARPASVPVDLAFDTDVISTNKNRSDGAMDSKKRAYPAEQLPSSLTVEDVTFRLGSSADGSKNALACRGQDIALPAGDFDHLDLLWAASDADVKTQIQVDGKPVPVRVGHWTGYIGQWDHRLWKGKVPEMASGWTNELAGIEPGFVKPDCVAWYCSHHHTPKGDAYYLYSYLFKTTVDLPRGAKSIRLPSDEQVKLFAASVVRGSGRVTAAAPLFDTLADHKQDGIRVAPANGKFMDATAVRIEPRLYWREGAIRYTVDGSEPTLSSPVYTEPFTVVRPTPVQAAIVFEENGTERLGPVVSTTIDVNDITPPSVVKAAADYEEPRVHVQFSERVVPSSLAPSHFAFNPAIQVQNVQPGDDGRSVTLELASPLQLNKPYHLKITGIQDFSPSHNELKAAAVDLQVSGPVFHLESVPSELRGQVKRNIKGLPTRGTDPWTINMFVRADKEPADKTLFAGFGKCAQDASGTARYIGSFWGALRFWSHNSDVPSRTRFDTQAWQMLTATYDGKTLRLYQNGRRIGQRDVTLSDDENAVRFAPIDPWEHQRSFDGDIREFAIWSTALGENAIKSLKKRTTLP